MTDEHFCTCTDLECALNPNNPRCRRRSCDACIRKCLKAGEIPSCFFKSAHPDTSANDGWTYRGFADYLSKHGDGRERRWGGVETDRDEAGGLTS